MKTNIIKNNTQFLYFSMLISCPCVIQPGEHRSDQKDNCTIYSCTNINGQLISSTSTINCPSFNESRCKPVSNF